MHSTFLSCWTVYSRHQYEIEQRSGDLRSVICTTGRASSLPTVARVLDESSAESEQPELCASTAGSDAAPPVRIFLV